MSDSLVCLEASIQQCWTHFWHCLHLLGNFNTFFSPSTFETEQDLVGFLGMEAFPCPPFLVCRKQTAASMTFPASQRANRKVAYQGREGRQRQGRSSQETIAQPWGRVLVPSEGIHITISLSSLQILKPPKNGVSILHFREDHQRTD